MSFARHTLAVASFSIVALVACGEPSAPRGGEALAATVTQHTLTAGEQASFVKVSTESHTVVILVQHPAAGCAYEATATVARSPGALDVVAHVGMNPAADCLPIPASSVVTYELRIPNVSNGSVSVRLFEAFENSPTKLVAQVKTAVNG